MTNIVLLSTGQTTCTCKHTSVTREKGTEERSGVEPNLALLVKTHIRKAFQFPVNDMSKFISYQDSDACLDYNTCDFPVIDGI